MIGKFEAISNEFPGPATSMAPHPKNAEIE